MPYRANAKCFVFLIGVSISCLSPWLALKAVGCPAFTFGSKAPKLIGKKRSRLALFVGGREGHFKQIPVQVDPIDYSGRLIFSKNERELDGPLGYLDRISFDTRNFSDIGGLAANVPCDAEEVYRVRLSSNRNKGAFLALCSQSQTGKFGSPIFFSQKDMFISATGYRYGYQERNHILFDSISLAFYGKEPGQLEVARQSDIRIRSDIKNFFSLVFDPSDIESYLESYRLGPVGAVGKVAFYLKVLFFKIKLSLTTDVSFFSDSAYIPMVMHLPYSGREHLNKGSGIVYNWLPVNAKVLQVEMPEFTENLPIATVEKNYCKGSFCRFSYQAQRSEKIIGMSFRLSRDLIRMGFYPHYLEGLPKKLATKLGLGSRSEGERTGFYFETSGLAKGDHKWDYWLSLGGGVDQCPAKVNLEKL